jgi:sec-independent protein translocase protein TatA
MLGFESPSHIIIVLLIALLVFGPKRLPEMGKSLGQSIRGFRSSLERDEPATPPAAPPAEQPRSVESSTLR